jgi:hypothetical protein
MKYHWDKFLVEGAELFDNMVNNIENMIDGESIKHFRIRDGIYIEILHM